MDPNWVTPLQAEHRPDDADGLRLAGLRRRAPSASPRGDLARAPHSTANNNAGLNINWHPVPEGSVQSLAGAGSTVYIGSGSFVDSLPQPAIIGVNATTFMSTDTPSFAPVLGRGRQQLPSGQTSGVRAIGASGADVVAGGTFTTAGGVDRRNLAAIDLTTGQPTPFDPPMKGMFSALRPSTPLPLTNDGLVWAGGEFLTEGPNPRTYLAAFDASTGAIASFHRDPNVGALGGSARSSRRARPSTSEAASRRSAGCPGATSLPFMNVPGQDGTVLPFDVDVDGPVRSLALAGDTLYLGGQFQNVNGALAALKRERHNLAAVDPTTGLARAWDPDAHGAVNALAIEGNTSSPAASSTRSTAGAACSGSPHSTNRTARRAPGSRRRRAGAVARGVTGPTLFAGGDFANAGGVPRSGIADFDAQTGAPDTFSPLLRPRSAAGPRRRRRARGCAVRVAATGLLTGGSFVMISPTPRTANLSLLRAGAAAARRRDTRRARPGRRRRSARPATAWRPTWPLSASAKRFRVGPGATPADGTATRRGEEKEEAAARHDADAAPERARAREVRGPGQGQGPQGRQALRQADAAEPQAQALHAADRKKRRSRARLPAGRSKVKWSGRMGRKALKRGSLRAARHAHGRRRQHRQGAHAVVHDRALTTSPAMTVTRSVVLR